MSVLQYHWPWCVAHSTDYPYSAYLTPHTALLFGRCSDTQWLRFRYMAARYRARVGYLFATLTPTIADSACMGLRSVDISMAAPFL